MQVLAGIAVKEKKIHRDKECRPARATTSTVHVLRNTIIMMIIEASPTLNR